MELNWQMWLIFAIAIAVVLLGIFVLSAITSVVVRLVARRHGAAQILIDRGRWPFRSVLLVIGLWIAFLVALPEQSWAGWIDHLMLILLIGTSAWLVAQLMLTFADIWTGRYRLDVADNGNARRVRTQLQIVRRLGVAIIVIIAVGSILLTFDGVRAVGASVLASAGIASVVAGLAAQTVLANVFAGVQLAFSAAIRVQDVVVVDGEWGRIREITLTYVVVTTWDERTLVLPCTYFTTTPFENWTKYGSELIGAVEFDLDWRISTDAMRDELDRLLAETELWDHRTSVLQVTDATNGYVRVRVLVSAADSAAVWDLRCLVREQLVEWIREADVNALPQQRFMLGGTSEHRLVEAQPAARAGTKGSKSSKRADATTDAAADESSANSPKTATSPVPTTTGSTRAGFFSGSPDGEERASSFTRAIPVHDEAERHDEDRGRGERTHDDDAGSQQDGDF